MFQSEIAAVNNGDPLCP